MPRFGKGITRIFGMLFLAAAVLMAAEARANEDRKPPKIDRAIYFHQEMKRRPPGTAPERHRQVVADLRLNDRNLDAEECALYVERRLQTSEIRDLARSGIEVHPTVWVPPQGDRHPFGFHLAVVPYSALETLRDFAPILRVVSVERRLDPLNDLGAEMIGLDVVRSGQFGVPADASGVRLAIADSGTDLTHPDLPAPVEAFDMTDGTDPATWGTDVSNQVTNHGTHVSGTALGNGSLSGDQYMGAAPGADFYFYKIGNDGTGGASPSDIIEAIQRASAVGCDVFSMSYGGFSTYLDGSEAKEAAIDQAVADGMTVFISAGNEADGHKHYSVFVAPNTTTGIFQFAIDNSGNPNPAGTERINVVWIDNGTFDQNLSLSCSNLGTGESLVDVASGVSDRGTEARLYSLSPSIPAGGQKTYNLTLSNNAVSGGTPRVHCCAWDDRGLFPSADPSFTVCSPAVADGAIAVGAWTHRVEWTDYLGNDHADNANSVNTLATFSSRGPRVDGLMKPDLASPGCWTISLLDNGNATLPRGVTDGFIIDNDGVIGSGPANYAISSGTSMASPLAAGAAAVLLEADPSLGPQGVRDLMTATASNAESPDNDAGYGLIDVLDAYGRILEDFVWVDFDYSGFEFGTFDHPFNTLSEALGALPGGPDDRIRIKAGSSSETLSIDVPVSIDAFGGTATIGEQP
ncbi:MAG: S8 family serine peptidase [Candidatus Eisenbacteria bacterium]